MIKHIGLIPVTLLLAGLMTAGCYNSSNGTQDAAPDDSHAVDEDAAQQEADVLPDRPDLPLDRPPDYPLDRTPDFPVDWPADYPIDLPPDTTCIQEGCLLSSGGICCPGLVQASECDPSSGDPACAMLFCIRDNDAFCGFRENCFNSMYDCREPPCDGDAGGGYSCSPIESHSCTCGGGECRPVCRADASGAMGWVDPCTGALIRTDDCTGQTAVCDELCSESEGWYESYTGELIAWDTCAYWWHCEVIW